MTTEQAQQAAKQAIRQMRYGKDDYFWINDTQPRMVMHPTNPKMDGQDLSSYADPNGLHLFVKAVELCRNNGEGTIEYMWAKPGLTEPAPKISFVKQYAPWGWIVGSGIYVDDVRAESRSMLLLLLSAAGVVAILSVAVAVLMTRSIARPIQQVVSDLGSGADQIAEAWRRVSRPCRAQCNRAHINARLFLAPRCVVSSLVDCGLENCRGLCRPISIPRLALRRSVSFE